jgi:uncharacterized protein (DUF1800 family)
MTSFALHASMRFGLGPTPDEQPGGDPRGWLLAQLDPALALPKGLRRIPGGSERTAELLAKRDKGDGELEKFVKGEGKDAFIQDMTRHLAAQVESAAPFVERLVAFWLNHFTVSVERPAVLGLAGPFSVEVVRRHLFGRFAELLLAATRHQAMLLYLDNAVSFGPNSVAGRKTGRGLNENLAREILELHTLGVDGGYGQADVRNFALILTGWTLQRPKDPDPGAFWFVDLAHEPGDKTLLGQRYREAGEDEGLRALAMLGVHPSTARHLAIKLARHFIADEPPAGAVETLTRTFLDSGGDLPALYRALVGLQAAWDNPLAKLRTPQELVLATFRSVGYSKDMKGALGSLKLMNHLPCAAPSPAGYPDLATAWAAPDQVLRRVDWAAAAGERMARTVEPEALLATALGGGADPDLVFQVRNSPSRAEAIALVLACPTFQRR